MGADFHIVIPSRFAASRLPGKPLRQIAGRTMVARVWDRAMASGANQVLVAADDTRIVDEIERCGGVAMLTSQEHASGTDRLAEVARRLRWSDDTIVVNLQGDEPCIPEGLSSELAACLLANPSASIATMATPIYTAEELFSDNAVKVVISDAGKALYFSRAPVPWVRGHFRPGERPAQLPTGYSFYRHIGMYAYRAGVLQQLAAQPQAAIERAESLEQLRAMAMGVDIHVRIIDEAPPPGVDTEADLAAAEKFFAQGT